MPRSADCPWSVKRLTYARPVARIVVVGLALFALAGCSSSGSGAKAVDTTAIKPAPSASGKTTTTTVLVSPTPTTTELGSASRDLKGIQAAIKATGVPCEGVPHRYVEAKNGSTVGVAPVFELTCAAGNGVEIKVWEWSGPSAKRVSLRLAASLVCSAGLVNTTYLESGRWSVSAYRDLETDSALTERLGEALGVKPTVVKCPTR